MNIFTLVAITLVSFNLISCGDDSSDDQQNSSTDPAPEETLTIDPNARFTTGENATLILGEAGFNNAGFLSASNDGLSFNHQKGIASDDTHLLIADGNNNRVLIWNSLPTGNQSPNIVLGQSNFTTNNSGSSLNEMNWPTSVATDGTRVFVSDAYNNRVLVWNTYPTSNGQAADFEITASSDSLGWPWDVWTDGTKLMVTNTAGSNVLVWNSIPSADSSSDYQLSSNDEMGTPRTITSDGSTFLLVSDHNQIRDSSIQGNGNFYWDSFPATDLSATDFIQDFSGDVNFAWLQGDVAKDNAIYLYAKNLYKLDNKAALTAKTPSQTIDTVVNVNGSDTFQNFFEGGDGSDLVVVDSDNDGTDDRIYVSTYNGNRIVAFNNIDSSIAETPNFSIGSTDINTNDLVHVKNHLGNPTPACSIDKLFVTSDFDRQLSGWNTRPTSDNQAPDFSMSFSITSYIGNPDLANKMDSQPTSMTLLDDTLMVYAQMDKKLFFWNSLPSTSTSYPDAYYKNNIGTITLGADVTYDSTYLYALHDNNTKLAIWDVSSGLIDVNDTTTAPNIIINLSTEASSIKSDGTYVSITNIFSHNVVIYKVSDITANQSAVTAFTTLSVANGNGGFNLPTQTITFGDKLFVADNSNNRVHIWNDILTAKNGNEADTILGQVDNVEKNNKKTIDGLFWPKNLCFNGVDLWVGEFKFSGRLVKFEAE